MTDPTRPMKSGNMALHDLPGGWEDRGEPLHAIVTARFALLEMALEALDESQLWFADDDLECVHASQAQCEEAVALPGGYVRMRVRGAEDTARAVGILLGRGATRVDVFSPDLRRAESHGLCG